MEQLWFFLLGGMFAIYVVLDGFDFGVGILHLFVARTPAEREQALKSIGPIWDGNEVWLIAAGGTLLAVFPALYAASFSGFYLPLMVVLWLLLFRALGIELQHQLHDRMWAQMWDVIFSAASLLLTVFFGAALGNLLRGVSLGADGTFFAPLWTNFRVGQDVGILDWYTMLVALLALSALTLHGASWLVWRTDGAVSLRAGRLLTPLAALSAMLTGLVTWATLIVRPGLLDNLSLYPAGCLFPILSVGGGLLFVTGQRGNVPARCFAGTSLFVFGLVMSALFGIFPDVLPARDPRFSLSGAAAAAAPETLKATLVWWIPGMVLVGFYSWFTYSRLPTVTIATHGAAPAHEPAEP